MRSTGVEQLLDLVSLEHLGCRRRGSRDGPSGRPRARSDAGGLAHHVETVAPDPDLGPVVVSPGDRHLAHRYIQRQGHGYQLCIPGKPGLAAVGEEPLPHRGWRSLGPALRIDDARGDRGLEEPVVGAAQEFTGAALAAGQGRRRQVAGADGEHVGGPGCIDDLLEVGERSGKIEVAECADAGGPACQAERDGSPFALVRSTDNLGGRVRASGEALFDDRRRRVRTSVVDEDEAAPGGLGGDEVDQRVDEVADPIPFVEHRNDEAHGCGHSGTKKMATVWRCHRRSSSAYRV